MALEAVDMVETKKGESLGGEEDLILSERTADQIVCEGCMWNR